MRSVGGLEWGSGGEGWSWILGATREERTILHDSAHVKGLYAHIHTGAVCHIICLGEAKEGRKTGGMGGTRDRRSD